MFVSRIGKLALLITLTVAGSTATVGVQTITPNLYADLAWRNVGPYDGPVASIVGVPGEAGIYTITTPSGSVWKTIDGGGTWVPRTTPGMDSGNRFPESSWTDPANPRRIVRTEAQGIAVSLDAGQTWVSSRHYLPIAEIASLSPRAVKPDPNAPKRTIAGKPVNVSIADPARAGLIFAGTNDEVYVSFDNGVHWESLRLNMPGVVINDLDIRGNSLVAATQGRSVWSLNDISPLRQLNAATASSTATLFKPADAVLNTSAILDYYLGAAATGEVRLEILDATGRVIHAAASAITQSPDLWLPATRPLPASAGHHRVEWNLRLDPPPAQKHRFARLAPALSDTPADPDGPVVLPGTYRVKLTVAGVTYTQPLVVRNDPDAAKFAMLATQRQQFALAMKMYDAMQIAHQEFVQLARLRAQLRPMLTSTDPQVALAAVDLDKRLAEIDGSDWTGLVIPDADDEAGEVDEKEGKHPDFVPPKPVSVSKDYDDPTSILGRRFANVDHTPAFATISATIGSMMSKARDVAAAPDVAADYNRSCEMLSGVLDTWRALNAQDVSRLNAQLAQQRVPLLPIATRVSVLACGAR